MTNTIKLPDWIEGPNTCEQPGLVSNVEELGTIIEDTCLLPQKTQEEEEAPKHRHIQYYRKLRCAIGGVGHFFTTFIGEYIFSTNGGLRWKHIGFLAYRNLRYSSSRTLVTVAAIASGSAAIVFLVGFAYGLQSIVTQRLVQPLSLRLADVQASSTALRLDEAAFTTITQLDGIEDAAGAVNIAGSLSYSGSRTETIVIGAQNKYLEYSHIELLAGEHFSPEAEMAYTGSTDQLADLIQSVQESGQVAGVSTLEEIVAGEPIQPGVLTNYRIKDDVYVPLHASPKQSADVVGYIKGSVLDSYEGIEVWGGSYNSSGTDGKRYMGVDGDWFGSWIQTKSLPLYQRLSSTEFLPVSDGAGNQTMGSGFIPTGEAQLLSKQEAQADAMVKSLLDEGEVLGESTGSGQLSSTVASTAASLVNSTWTAALASGSAKQDAQALQAAVAAETTARLASESAIRNAVISVSKPGGKEIIVSTGLLKVLNMTPEEAIGKTVSAELIVSGGVIPGLAGRVVSNPVEYSIVGVYDDPEKNVIFVPLADLKSMGISKYTLVKILARADSLLRPARERIESLGYSTRSIADTLAQVERLFIVMRFLLGSFGMIAFIVALFGMFNTLTVSLLERTREIGVMKTLGTTNADIVKLFLSESALMGAIGGFFGILLGVSTGVLLDLFSRFFREDKSVMLFDFPLPFLIGILVFAIAVGIFTGLYPATRAKKISALNALRYE